MKIENIRFKTHSKLVWCQRTSLSLIEGLTQYIYETSNMSSTVTDEKIDAHKVQSEVNIFRLNMYSRLNFKDFSRFTENVIPP